MTAGDAGLKYARVERERRFLLGSVPDLAMALRVLQIRDRYLMGTTLRLREVREAGRPTSYKLGQKVRLGDGTPIEVAHTTVYLTAAEHSLLAGLPGHELTKTRSLLPVEDAIFAVDIFAGPLLGLVLAEVDLERVSDLPPRLPLPVIGEVTADERFTGGVLARIGTEDLQNATEHYRHK